MSRTVAMSRRVWPLAGVLSLQRLAVTCTFLRHGHHSLIIRLEACVSLTCSPRPPTETGQASPSGLCALLPCLTDRVTLSCLCCLPNLPQVTSFASAHLHPRPEAASCLLLPLQQPPEPFSPFHAWHNRPSPPQHQVLNLSDAFWDMYL